MKIKSIKFTGLNYSQCLREFQEFIISKGFNIEIIDVYVSVKQEIVTVNLKYCENGGK